METWAIDGVPLLSLASEVQRLDGKIVPPVRGDNRKYAFRPGAGYRPRVTDSQTITLGLWLIGQDGPGGRSDWEGNYSAAERQLRTLLRPDYGAEFEITRTWTDDLGTHTATGKGAAEDIDRSRIGRYAGKVTVDVHMADPFFYGSPITVPLALGVPATVNNPGDEATTNAWIDLTGQLSNPQLSNTTEDPPVWVKLGTDIANGDGVLVDTELDAVTRESDGANLIGALTHSGARSWFRVGRGSSSVTLSADAGAGSGTLTIWPVYY
jgi:hypothetical protein